MNIAYLSIGSNVDKEQNLPTCIGILAQHGRLLAVSGVYETAPMGNPADPVFFNAAVALQTSQTATSLKAHTLSAIEQQLGRQRGENANAPRTIDIDISLFNDEVFDLGHRHIPDPELLRYPHVIVPLAEIAPAYRHPETGQTLAAIARQVLTASNQALARRDDIDLRAFLA